MKITVSIVTKDRAIDLVHCLGSLVAQSTKVDELLIVSSSQLQANQEKRILNGFSKNTKLVIRYIKESKNGFPYAYNRALKEASHDWVSFIDDDCIVDTKWLENIKKTVTNKKSLAAILEKSETFYSDNIFSLSRHFHNELGKIHSLHSTTITDLEILDAKSVTYNNVFLKKNFISCDESLVLYGRGASQDCDLGMQIQQHKGAAIYNNDIVVTHKDSTGFLSYYKGLVSNTYHHLIYETKWQLVRNRTKRVAITDALTFFNKYRKEQNVPTIKSVLVVCTLAISYLIITALRLIFQIKKSFSLIKTPPPV